MSTDVIRKETVLRATPQRVWRALSDSAEFGRWFGIRFDQPFTPGATMSGAIVGTEADAEVAKAQKQYEGKKFEITIERMEPERLFSFRWHPHAVEPDIDYSTEPTTLIEFAMEVVAEGVRLTITESGFDRIPLERRAKAFTANDGGWTIMAKVLGEYVALAP